MLTNESLTPERLNNAEEYIAELKRMYQFELGSPFEMNPGMRARLLKPYMAFDTALELIKKFREESE